MKAVPDRAQQPVRAHALRDGKTLYMAAPKLAEPLPFYHLDPATVPVSPDQAASRHVAATIARPVGVDDMQPVDLVACGSVAVNRHGARLGKGAGDTDIEFALLHEADLIQPTTMIITTVHDLQVVDDDLPETRHDFRVDLIVHPDTGHHPRPGPQRPRVCSGTTSMTTPSPRSPSSQLAGATNPADTARCVGSGHAAVRSVARAGRS